MTFSQASRGMTLLNRWLAGTTIYDSYQKFIRSIVEPSFNRLGVEVIANEPKLDRYARQIAINLACEAKLESCLTQTAQKLAQIVTQDIKIAPDLQSVIYCNGLRQASPITFFVLQKKMLQSQNQAERTLIINALGCSQDEYLLYQFLQLINIPGDAFRLQEKLRILAALLNNGDIGLHILIEFMEYNYDSIIALSPGQINSMLSNIASRIATENRLRQFDALVTFLESKSIISGENGVNFKSAARINMDWQTKHLASVSQWFENLEEPLTSTTVASTTLSDETTTQFAQTVSISLTIILVGFLTFFI